MAADKSLWEAGFRRLRIAVIGDFDAADILERSRQRVQNAREALGHTSLHRARRTISDRASPPTVDTMGSGHKYFALFLDAHGVVSTHKLLACDDDEATKRAQTHADARAFDVWDGWRFVGRFEAATRG